MRLLLKFSVFFIIFFAVGYTFSDAAFFSKLANQHKLHTPDDAWAFLGSHVYPARPGQKTTSSLSARYLLTQQRYLYCDEGALLMATLLRGTGYRTRLMDLYGYDGISHHTVLEVEENGRWHVYDTLNRLRHTTPKGAATACGFELMRPELRPSWSWYRSAYFYNGFFKFIIFKIRDIPG